LRFAGAILAAAALMFCIARHALTRLRCRSAMRLAELTAEIEFRDLESLLTEFLFEFGTFPYCFVFSLAKLGLERRMCN
jgi:hypothetical protein